MDIKKEYGTCTKTLDMAERLNVLCGNIENERIKNIKELMKEMEELKEKEYRGFFFNKIINKRIEVQQLNKLVEISELQAKVFTDLNKVFELIPREELRDRIQQLNMQ